MKVFTEPRQERLFESVRRFYKANSFDYAHNIDHVVRVIWWCRLLAKKEKAELSILLPAAIVHDLGMLEGIKHSHAKASYKMCHPFLKKCGYKKDEIKEIAETVLVHSSSDRQFPKTIEGKVMFDADKLDAVNAIGIHRWFFEYARKGYKHHSAIKEILADVKLWKKIVGNTPFYTKTGKRIGSKGLHYIERVFNDVDADFKKFRKIYRELKIGRLNGLN
jgi:uncharacterized protein